MLIEVTEELCMTCWCKKPVSGWWRIDDGDDAQEFFCSDECYAETQPIDESDQYFEGGSMANRLNTGVFQPEGDWPGIFIRGDEALSHANRLSILLRAHEKRAEHEDIPDDERLAWARLNDLVALLGSCRVPLPEPD